MYVCRGLMFSAEIVLGYRVSLVLGRGVLLSPNWFSAATSLKCAIDLLDLLPSNFFFSRGLRVEGREGSIDTFLFLFLSFRSRRVEKTSHRLRLPVFRAILAELLHSPSSTKTGEGVQLSNPSPTFGLLSCCLLPGASGVDLWS